MINPTISTKKITIDPNRLKNSKHLINKYKNLANRMQFLVNSKKLGCRAVQLHSL